MIVEFDKSFLKSLNKIGDRRILKRIESKITEFEKATCLDEISNVKKLTGYTYYFRARVSDYRIGFEQINPGTIRLIIAANRNDIYRRFP
jgi:mRNA interferase RelE/StbE